MTELTVVVPTFERAAILDRCLEHLAAQTIGADRFEVVVVDDQSSDTTPDVLRRWTTSDRLRVTSVRPATKLFAGGARNRAASLASSARLLFLGDDIHADADLLERHLDAADRHGPASIVVGEVRLDGRTPFMSWLERVGVHHDFPTMRAIGGPLPGRYFYACNASVPTALFREVGGFDERIQRAWEDSELGVRLVRGGGMMWFAPDAGGTHVHPLDLDRYVRFLRAGRADVQRAAAAMRAAGESVPVPQDHPVLDAVVTDGVIDAVVAATQRTERHLPQPWRESLYRRVVRYERRRALQAGLRASA